MLNPEILWIEPNIKSLLIPLQEFKLGICCHNSTSISLVSKPSSISNYSFKLTIPYAKQTLVWEISFNPLYPELGPEIIIDGEEFVQTENLKNFSKYLFHFIQWKFTDKLSLVKVLNEFLYFYKQKQVKLLKKAAVSLHSEYLLLKDILDFENLEILVTNGLKQTEVKFLFKICIDSSNVSTSQTNLLEDDVLLFINFYGTSFNRISPELYLSPYLKTIFNNVESLHIPPFTELYHIVDYISEIKRIISNKINILLQCMEARKNFIASLITLQHESVIEYDIITYRRISLLIEHSEQYFILNFSLPLSFPDEQFITTLHSVRYSTDQGKPYSRIIKNFPYSPRWEPKKMIIKILEHIINKEL